MDNDCLAEKPAVQTKRNSASGVDHFLSVARKQRSLVTLFLDNGVRFTGKIIDFDSYCILLNCGEAMVLVYKSAVSTVKKPSRRKPNGIAAPQTGGDPFSRAH